MISLFQRAASSGDENPFPIQVSTPALVAIIVGGLFLTLFFGFVVYGLETVLARFRANYTPRRIALPEDDEVGETSDAPPRSSVGSFWGMLRRTKKIEGWKGYLKGFMPGLLAGLVMGIITSGLSAFLESSNIIQSTIRALITVVLEAPFSVIWYRAIVTPKRLTWFGWTAGKEALLSRMERRRPWKLYLLPGVVAASFIHGAYILGSTIFIQEIIFPALRGKNPMQIGDIPTKIIVTQLSLYFVIVIISTALVTPLQVMLVRLSMQHPEDFVPATPAPETEAESTGAAPPVVNSALEPDTASLFGDPKETVVEVRDNGNPYTGIIDCAQKILKEEGVRALYRAWWVTFLSLMATYGAAAFVVTQGPK